MGAAAEAKPKYGANLKEPGVTEDRFTKLETLVNKMAEVVLKEKSLPCAPKRELSTDSSTLSSSGSSGTPRSRFSLTSSGRRRPRSARLFSQTRHMEKGEQLNSFEGLMVITFRTIIEMLEKGSQSWALSATDSQ